MALLKCVALAPDADVGPVGQPTFPGTPFGDIRYPGVQGFFTETRTRWVRLVAEWEYWEPGATSDPTSSDYQRHQYALDANIIRARKLGLRVILVTRGFAEFANDSTDRLQFPPASNLLPRGPYANWIFYLMNRYHPANRFASPPAPGKLDQRFRWIDFFEVVNEPNFECHPQILTVPGTALMFSTAYGIARNLNAHKRINGQLTTPRPLRLMGPSTSDYARGNTANHMNYNKFTRLLLRALKLEGERHFPLKKNNIFAWSHHNYKDVANLMPLARATDRDPASGNRAQLVREILTGKWGGYPSPSVEDPRIYLTEGGYVRPKNMPTSRNQDKQQKTHLAQAIDRLKNKTGPGQPGDGIEMFTQYLFYSAPAYDSGLCRPAVSPPPPGFDPGAHERPAYGTWQHDF